MENKPAETNVTRRKASWPRKTIPWAAAAVVVIGGGAYWLEHGHAATRSGFTQTIRYTTVQTGNVAETVSLSGTLNPASEVTVAESGTITAIDVKVGQHVTKGQTIGKVDTTSLTYQLQSAEAQMTAAEAQLTQAEDNASSGSSAGSASGQGQNTSNSASSVAQAQASVNEAQNQVNQLDSEIAAGTAKSPISGTVLEVGSVSGSSAPTSSSSSSTGSNSSGNSNTIAVIADLSSSDFIVDADVAQADVSKLKVGNQATMSLSSDATSTLTGKVTSISYMPQSTSGVTEYPVTLKVDKPTDSSVKPLPGETVAVTTIVAEHKNVLEVPSAAITDLRGQTGVFVQAGSKGSSQSTSGGQQYPGMSRVPSGLTFVPVQTGLVGGNMTEITSGLKAGEQIAIVTQNTASTTSTTSSQGFSRGGFGGFGGGTGFAGSGYGGYDGGRSSSRSYSRSSSGQTGGN